MPLGFVGKTMAIVGIVEPVAFFLSIKMLSKVVFPHALILVVNDFVASINSLFSQLVVMLIKSG